jgi:hypothetical protein
MRSLRIGATIILLSPLAACGHQLVGWPVADLTAPTVISVSPLDGATSVGRNAGLAATFSEPMDPTTFTTATFTLEDGAADVTATVTYDGLTALFAPAGLLDADSVYHATIASSVTDVAGNAMAADYAWTFTTGRFVDVTPPEVTATNPVRGATGVAIQSNVFASFNEPMDPSTLTDATFTLRDGATPVAGSVQGTGPSVVFDPTNDLVAGTLYTAMITTGAEDLAGNGLAQDYVWTFTAVEQLDETPPRVVLTNPDDGFQGVVIGSTVIAAFSEVMDASTLTDVTFLLDGPGTASVAGSVTYNPLTPVGVFTPDQPLEQDTTYTATVKASVTDLAGNAMLADYVWTFKTRSDLDLVAPYVVLTSPDDHAFDVPVSALLTAAFSEPMAPATVTDLTFLLTGPGPVTINGTVAYDLLTPVATFTPDVELDANTDYIATVTTGAEDLAGNPMVQDYVWTFKTGSLLDVERPTVVATHPVDQAIDVPIDTTVEAAFSEAMDATTLDSSSFVVTGPGPSTLTGLLVYDPLSLTVSFTPDTPLLLDSVYDARVAASASDLAGNTMVQDYLWSFTTVAAPTGLQPIDLGSLETFVAVAGAGLTNSNSSGITTLNGDVGLSPTGTCLGDGSPCTLTNPVINGTLYANDPGGVAAQAKVDLTAALIDGLGRPPGPIRSDLSGLILAPGVYTSPTESTMSIAVGGTVVLDAQGDPNAVWIFQVGSSLTVNNNAQVLLVNGARAKNVFWAMGASSTLGTNVSFQGSILAQASNSVGTDSVVVGRLLCTDGTITLLSNNVTLPPL